MSDPDPIEVSRNTYVYNENRIVRKGLLLYYDPLFVSDLGSSTLSSLNTIDNNYPATDPTGILYPTGINAALCNILLTSLNYPLEQSESVSIYSESHVVRRGLLLYYDPLLCSDLNSLSLSYLNTLDTTLPSVDPTGTSYPIGINASIQNLVIPIPQHYVNLPQYLLTNQGNLFEGFETIGDWTAILGTATANTTAGEFRTGIQSIKITNGLAVHGVIQKVFGSSINFGGAAPHMRLYYYLYPADIANFSVLVVQFYTNAGLGTYQETVLNGAYRALKSGWNVFDILPSSWSGNASWSANFDRMWVRITPQGGTQINVSFDNLLSGLVGQTPTCTIMFDDADASVYNIAYQYMKNRNARGTFYVRTGYVNTASYITNTQLLEMDAAGWAIGNHSRNHTYLTTLSQADATIEILAGKTDLDGWGLTRNSNHLAYPGCFYNDTVIAAAIAAGTLTARGCTMNSPCLDAYFDDRYVLQINVAVDISNSLATLKAYVDEAVTYGRNVGILIHTIPGDITAANFYALIDYIISLGMPFLTIEDIYNLLSNPISIVV